MKSRQRIGLIAITILLISVVSFTVIATAPPPPPPSAPSSMNATAVSASQINLTWSDNSGNETGFRIYRSPNGSSSWSLVKTTGANVESWSNTGLSEGARWYYRVRAYNAGGNSSYSNTDNDYTWPNTPSGLSASAVSGTEIQVSWTDNSSVETAYKLENSPNGSSSWTTVDLSASATSYDHESLDNDTTKYYRVRAYSSTSGKYSSYSGTDSDTTWDLVLCTF